MRLYTYKTVDKLANRLITEKGYEQVVIDEGVLGSGTFYLISDDDNLYNFEIREIALNSWESAHKIRRFKKLSKRQLTEIRLAEITENLNEECISWDDVVWLQNHKKEVLKTENIRLIECAGISEEEYNKIA